MVPNMTNELLFVMLHPEEADRVEEIVLAEMPVGLRELLLRQRNEYNLKLRECRPEMK
jgi:hypothetical protein